MENSSLKMGHLYLDDLLGVNNNLISVLTEKRPWAFYKLSDISFEFDLDWAFLISRFFKGNNLDKFDLADLILI